MNFKPVLSVIFLTFSLLLIACGGGTTPEQSNAVSQDQIEGNWHVAEAQRDGQVTETLNGLYFRFSKEGQLATNLMGADVESPYELIATKIIQKSTPPLEFDIDTVDDKKLVLLTTLQDMNFKLVLEKGE